MKKILFISATSNTNLKLANDLSDIFQSITTHNVEVINIEKYNLPLFNPATLEIDKKNNLKNIIEITDKMILFDAFVICAPEYNGNVPPVLTNAIAWISVSTNYWKDGFKDKHVFIASSSGGEAWKFQISIKNQLEHLGAIVFKTNIIVNSKNSFNRDYSKNIIKDFLKVL